MEPGRLVSLLAVALLLRPGCVSCFLLSAVAVRVRVRVRVRVPFPRLSAVRRLALPVGVGLQEGVTEGRLELRWLTHGNLLCAEIKEKEG